MISKLKGGYSSLAGLIFQSWLKDVHVHVEDRRLTQREAMQLVKDFTVEHAQDEVEFYMAMIAEEDQSLKGLIDHIHDAFQSGKTLSELISNFMAGLRRPERPKAPLPMICRCWPERLLHISHLSEKRPINSLRPNMHINCGINIMLQWPAVHCSPPQKRNPSQDFGDA